MQINNKVPSFGTGLILQRNDGKQISNFSKRQLRSAFRDTVPHGAMPNFVNSIMHLKAFLASDFLPNEIAIISPDFMDKICFWFKGEQTSHYIAPVSEIGDKLAIKYISNIAKKLQL